MKRKLMSFIAVLGLAVILASCGKVPQAKIDATVAAIDSVKAIGADVYVPEAFKAIQDSMNVVNQVVEVNKSKLFKSYKKADKMLDVVSQMVADTKVKTEAKKAEVKAETEKLIVDVKALIEENSKMMLKAPRGKEGRMALEAINADVQVIITTVAEAEKLLADGTYMEANTKIKSAQEKANSIKTELDGVLKKAGRK